MAEIQSPVDVFLGGTCNGSTWRDQVIPVLEERGFSYFNPVVENWTPECMEIEKYHRETAGTILYVLTPRMTGYYSVAEVVEDSNKRPQNTKLVLVENDEGAEFTSHQLKSLKQVAALVKKNGAEVFLSFDEFLNYLHNPLQATILGV